jgi:hypothetical protein
VNECTNPSPCDENAECTNTIGSHYCTCNTGFSGNGVSCVGKHIFKNSLLLSIWKAFSSESFPCYSAIRSVCMTVFWLYTDINECGTPSSCPQYSVCNNTLGSFSCYCQAGFREVGDRCEGKHS